MLLKSERMEERKTYQANINHKKAGVVMLVSGKLQFQRSHITRDIEENYKMIKGSILQGDIIDEDV